MSTPTQPSAAAMAAEEALRMADLLSPFASPCMPARLIDAQFAPLVTACRYVLQFLEETGQLDTVHPSLPNKLRAALATFAARELTPEKGSAAPI